MDVMLWLRQRSAKKRMREIYEKSIGSEESRIYATSVIVLVENHLIIKECKRRPEEQQQGFMLTCATYFIWLTQNVLSNIRNITICHEFQNSLRSLIESEWWWDPEVFFNLVNIMCDRMPIAFEIEHPYPLIDIIECGNMVGYNLTQDSPLEFAYFIISISNTHCDAIKDIAIGYS